MEKNENLQGNICWSLYVTVITFVWFRLADSNSWYMWTSHMNTEAARCIVESCCHFFLTNGENERITLELWSSLQDLSGYETLQKQIAHKSKRFMFV